ncbi:tetratricopeptide repeat protein, partial [Streptomyces sp. NPDC090085]|uniref:tetratricopeptide repeat protein n=1 Tax=Streptomyces sp. NPDC090085 TaxID=3365943 RepID=UPI0037F76106
MAIGIVGQVNIHAAPREPASWPHQIGVIPSRAVTFQERLEAGRLRDAVADGGTAVLGQVLTGMGGVGKTQLAADYARTAWQDGSLDLLLWVTASSRTAVIMSYARAGAALLQADLDDPEQAAQAFLARLTPNGGTQRRRWLVVLDDVADPDDLRGLWPPSNPNGRTLVTTRCRYAALTGEGRRRIDVGLFTRSEAADYLTRSLAAHDRQEPEEQITALADDLGHLPLALAQAVAYLIDSDETIAAYRDLLADRTSTLADTTPDRLPDDQDLPLAAVWSLSVARADTLTPAGLARPMLDLTALLDPNGIPQTVLTSTPVLNHLTQHRTHPHPDPDREPEPVSPRDAARALRALNRLSLIDHNPTTPHQAVRVHQLIQRTTRDTHTPDQHAHLARTSADALSDAWPEVERDTALAQALRANTNALTACAKDVLYRPDMHRVLFLMGRSLGNSGQVTAALSHFQQLTAIASHHLGSDHPDTLTNRSSLAHWRGAAGDAAGAATAFAELLDDEVRVLGPDHPYTLATRGNLALWRGKSGDAAGAVEAFAELLEDRLRVLGPDHPYTLATRGNLACFQGESGDPAGAVEAFAELLDDELRVLGPDHPDTLTTRNNLALWRGKAGDAAGAATAFAELLEDLVRVLGPDDPDTLT